MNFGILPIRSQSYREPDLTNFRPCPQSSDQLENFVIPKQVMAIVFTITEKIRGGYTASAIGEAIATEGKDIEDLYTNIRTSTIDYFGSDRAPKTARLYFLREEVLNIFPDQSGQSN